MHAHDLGDLADAEDLHEVAAAFIEAWNTRDLAAFVALFGGDGVLLDDGRRFTTAEEIATFARDGLMNYDVVLEEVVLTEPGRQLLNVRIGRGGSPGFRASFDLSFDADQIGVADLNTR